MSTSLGKLLSLVLLAIGWASIIRHGGLFYGIDFRGGTLVYVRFNSTPQVDKIRQGLASAGLPNSSIQQISDVADPTSKNDVVIGLEQQGDAFACGETALGMLALGGLGAAAETDRIGLR